ncbi:MAG TPA: globin family protein [Planctomycetota bacterium]|nr:globin family protein [Planctomycetota bacterium]
MSLTPQQLADVQRTWELCVPIADTAADLFYAKLFQLDPKLRVLFPSELKEQKQRLMTMLTAVVRGLKDLGALVPAVQALGKRHVAYGVKEQDYDTVGVALLDTLEKGLGPNWNPQVKDAWVVVYGVLASTMKAAAT